MSPRMSPSIERNELINAAQPVARGAVGELLGRYDRVWYW